MSYVPSYMGNQIRVDDSKLIQEENKNFCEPEDFESTVQIKELNEMPVRRGFSGIYDIQVSLKTQGQLQRIASTNHPIHIELTNDKTEALVTLSKNVDRTYVPSKDFVLYIRDTQMD